MKLKLEEHKRGDGRTYKSIRRIRIFRKKSSGEFESVLKLTRIDGVPYRSNTTLWNPTRYSKLGRHFLAQENINVISLTISLSLSR